MLDASHRIALAFERESLEDQIDGACLESLYAVSIPGWDFTSDRSKADPVNFGVWRTPLLLSGHSLAEIDPARLPVVHPEMTKDQLYNGFWRLARILPEAPSTYDDLDFDRTDPNDFYSSAARLTSVVRHLADRDWLVFSLLGHTIRDAVDFLHCALLNEPEIGKLLLAKRFREALAMRPELLDWNWPDETLARWKITDGKDYLPPFIFLVLLSEFQRLAQNVTSQITLSFRADGSPLTIASTMDDLAAVDVKQIGSSFSIFENCVANLTTMIPLQTYALLPPDSVMSTLNALRGIQRTEKAFRILNGAISNGPGDTLARLSGYSKQSPAAFVAQTMSAHPDHRRDRKVRGGGKAVRTEYLAKYWGLNWLEHPYLGLFQLASAADIFNAQYRNMRMPKRIAHHQNQVVNRRQAVARIANAWVETAHPAAYKVRCKELAIVRKTNDPYRDSPSDFGLDAAYQNQTGSASKSSARDRFKAGVEPIHSIVDLDGKMKERLLSKMKDRAAKRPEKGLPGYTAQYHAALWYLPDQENDDIGFWIGRRQVAQDNKIANLPSNSPMIVHEILSDIEFFREAPSKAEDRAMQNLAMIIGEFSSDPMHAFFRRKRFKLANSFISTRNAPPTYLQH